MTYCEHTPDVEAWWVTDIKFRTPYITQGKLCASCLKELIRGGRVLDTDEKVEAWWEANTK